jgi:hypothetical protein
MNKKRSIIIIGALLATAVTLSAAAFGKSRGCCMAKKIPSQERAQTATDAQLTHGLYLAMGVTGRYTIVPLCLASLLTGLVMSLGTRWGLFRSYWVMAKFLLTMLSTFVLFGFMRTLGHIGALAADTTMSIDELHKVSRSPVLHSGGGLLVLLVATLLSIYKPGGMTPYGLRKRREKREVLLAGLPSRSEADNQALLRSNSRTPLWVLAIGGFTIVMMLLFLVSHLAGGGLWKHH